MICAGQEVQASWPEAQEDSCHSQAVDKAWAEPDDQEDAEEVTLVLHSQVCCQGLGCTFFHRK